MTDLLLDEEEEVMCSSNDFCHKTFISMNQTLVGC
jgi:hypothetical protein